MNPVIDVGGNKKWFNEKDQLHRTDGPASEWADGSKAWYLNGALHRTDGPAYESAKGSKEWYLNGVLHRTDGPATEYANGTNEWYLNGTLVLSENLFLKLTGPVKKLPLYMGLGFDQFISERLQHESGH